MLPSGSRSAQRRPKCFRSPCLRPQHQLGTTSTGICSDLIANRHLSSISCSRPRRPLRRRSLHEVTRLADRVEIFAILTASSFRHWVPVSVYHTYIYLISRLYTRHRNVVVGHRIAHQVQSYDFGLYRTCLNGITFDYLPCYLYILLHRVAGIYPSHRIRSSLSLHQGLWINRALL